MPDTTDDVDAGSLQGATSLKRGMYGIFVLSLFVVFGFQLWYHAVRTTVTVDEPHHILAGHMHLRCGDFGINTEHPPLLKLLAASPLIIRKFEEPYRGCGTRINRKSDDFRNGMSFLAENGVDSIVVPARLAASTMSLLLAVIVFFAAREMFGRSEAVVALALLAFEPNLIAHGSLVTTDMALTATMFAAVYALYCYVKKPGLLRLLVTGLAVGLTLSSKHSGVLVLPILFLTFTVYFFVSRVSAGTGVWSIRILGNVAAFAGIVLIGTSVLWACYGLRFNALPNAAATGPFWVADSAYIIRPESSDWLSIRVIAKLNRLRVFPEAYTHGWVDVIVKGSRPMYLFNRSYPTGRWFYFPVALIIKTSVALLILMSLGFAGLGLYRTHGREMLFLLFPSLAFFAISMASPMNIGVRHILPVYPFFIVVSAAGACYWGKKHRAVLYALVALLVFHAGTAWRTAPDYIAFSNIFWGGVPNTHNTLADSNVEWGQNLKLAREYLEREKISDCWFVGNDNVEINRLLIPCRMLPGSTADWFNTQRPIEPTPAVIEGTVLLSAWVLPPMSKGRLPGGDEYLPVINSGPVAVIGGSILVYKGRFEVPRVAALTHVGRARQLMEENRFEEAAAQVSKAVDLMPDDPGIHHFLALALERIGRIEEAHREFAEAVRLEGTEPTPIR